MKLVWDGKAFALRLMVLVPFSTILTRSSTVPWAACFTAYCADCRHARRVAITLMANQVPDIGDSATS